MLDPALNPYQPPTGTDSLDSRASVYAMVRSAAGTIMVLVIAITLWTLSVTFLDRLIPSDFDMLLWSVSLLCSLFIAAMLVARTGRFRPRLTHLTLAGFAAIGVYAWLEGRASNAGGSLHAILFYTTAILVPAVLVVATALAPNHPDSTRSQ